MQYTTGILLESPDGDLIFQHRDNVPFIRDPGMISTFGGHSEPEDNGAVGTAARELEEETGLKIKTSKFKHLATFNMNKRMKSTTEYVYLVKNVNPNKIDLREGQGVVVISKGHDLAKLNLAPFSRYLINLYWKV